MSWHRFNLVGLPSRPADVKKKNTLDLHKIQFIYNG